jgi:type I restriction enzyme S subunit
MRSLGHGSHQTNLSSALLGGFAILLPPVTEQGKIAEILDTIDEAIRKTQEIIAKLKQVKQGLLHGLLTRGIDDNGELRDPERHPEEFKDSPLGPIPREWEVCRFGDLATSTTLGTAKRGAAKSSDNLRLLKMGNLRWGDLNLGDVERVSRDRVPDWRDLLLESGDLLFNTRNTPELVGKTAAWRAEFPDTVPDNNILRARFDPEVSGVFVAHYMGNGVGRQHIGRLSTGTTSVAAIYWKSLQHLLVPVPNRAEQDAIVNRVDSINDRLVTERKCGEKLMAAKQGLMDDLLTGRVRVTNLLKEAAE